MEIYVIRATGYGQTEHSAFDNALWNAGVANHNLILLSSIIPPTSEVRVVEHVNWNDCRFGDRLYCVMARKDATNFGQKVWAGIGWVQAADGSGLFVEHHASSEATLRRLISESLADMTPSRQREFGPIRTVMSCAECRGKPVCALVIACYQVEPW